MNWLGVVFDQQARKERINFFQRLTRLVTFTGILLLSVHVCVLTGVSQSATATLSGIVEDQNGAVVPGVNITAQNTGTSLERQAKTDDSGSFTIALLTPGTYTITARRDGFTPVAIRNVVLNVGDQKSLHIQLKAGDISATVQVTNEAPLVNESPAVGTLVNRQFVENLPLNGRSFQSLITLTPGIVLTDATFGNPGQFSVNGQRASTNYFTVDGVSANFGVNPTLGQAIGGALPGLTVDGGTNGLVSVDAMQEFRIQTSTYAPEFGRTPGAQISIITRSGTNQFRGTLFEYFRNDALDANDWFANANRLRRPPLRQNDFGGVLGGPIVLPRFGEGTPHFYRSTRSFFFFSYEGLRLRRPQVAIGVVPSLSARQAASPQMKPILNAWPLPNGADLGGGFARISASYADQSVLDATSVRIDHTINDKVTVFGRYNNAPSRSVARQSVLSSLLVSFVDTETLTLGSIQNFSPRVTNDLRFNYSIAKVGSLNEIDDFGGAQPPPDSVLFPSSVSSNHKRLTLQIFSFGTTTGVAVSSLPVGISSDADQQQYNLVNNLSLVAGNHQLKFGVDYRRLMPTSGETYSQIAGNSVFDPLTGTFPNKMPVQVIIKDVFKSVATNLSVYGQDTWRVTPRLTMTYGLRWEVNPPPKGRDGVEVPAVTGFDNPSSIALAPLGTPLWKTTYDNFAPRFGLSYQLFQTPGRETVVRGGLGIFYDLGVGGITGLVAGNFPYVRTKRFTTNVDFPLSPADAAPAPFTLVPVGQRINAYPSDLKLPRTYQWNLAVEQSLGTNQTMSATYVAAAGRKLLRNGLLFNVNTSFSAANFARNAAKSDYHAMQLQYQRRLSRGLQALASYTWSHSIDITSNDGVTNLFFNVPVLGKIDDDLDRGPSDFDVRHALSGAVTYNLPTPVPGNFGRAIFGDWSVDSIFSARSATPVDVTYGFFIPGCCTVRVRPDLVPGIPLYVDDPAAPGGRRFNNTRVTIPGNPNPQIGPFFTPAQLRQGTLERNALRGLPVWQIDMALRRQFGLTERVNIQLKAELFNIFNHPNFGNPSGDLTNSALFGRSNSMLGRRLGSGGLNGGLNPLYQVGGPRSIQFAFRLNF